MRYKKVLLVSPRFHKGRYLLSMHPLAGLGYVAESLKRNGFSVKTLDMNLKYDDRALEKAISAFDPDIIGFTVMTFGHRDLYDLIDRIKKVYPAVKIAVGGPHISTLREKVMKDCPGIDYSIVLEGDLGMVELCKGVEFDRIGGLIFRDGDRIVANGFRGFIMDLDSLPFPRYESFELDKYPARQIGIVTSRGCPHSCIFCPINAAIGRQYRQRSARNVLDEIDYWYRRGYRDVLVLDDNFTLSRKRTEDLCELIAGKDFKGLHLKCPNGIRADRVDRSLLKTMRRAGFDMISFGVESASDKVLKNIKKGEEIAVIEEGVKNACELGFDVDLFFIIGSPGETMKDLESSFSLARRYPIRSAKFYNMVPFPATELFDWISTNGYFLHPLDRMFNNASHFVNEPWFFTPEMSADERREAFRIGQSVSKCVRRKFIERKMGGRLFLRRAISWVYTVGLVENMMTNNELFIRLKEKMKTFFANKAKSS